MKAAALVIAVIVAILLVAVARSFTYVVPEGEQVVLLQFGKPVGEPVTEPGIRFKMPVTQQVYRLDKRLLQWDGPATEMTTNDKSYIVVDCFARWRIVDPLLYLQRVRDERTAQSRLDDVLGGETRNTIAKNRLIEVIRTTIGRRPPKEAQPIATAASQDVVLQAESEAPMISGWQPISVGRSKLEEEIFNSAAAKVGELGIELVDFRFKRINYNERVTEAIYKRMISERYQIAEQFRSEGAGEAAKISGERDRTLREIQSDAYRKTQDIMGKADAEAASIYSTAYTAKPEAAEFYDFTRSMDAYRKMLGRQDTLILSTKSDMLKYLTTSGSEESPAPSAVSPVTVPVETKPAQ